MAEQNTQGWDHSVDVLVVGSGAGAMTAALKSYDLGGDVLLIEKGSYYGGSSAMSGGGLWIPCNHLMPGVGIQDTPQEALTYFKATTKGLVPEVRLRAYLEKGPEMVRYLSDHTQVRFAAMPEYADYYPLCEGAKPGGRTIEAETFDGRTLGEEILHLREPGLQTLILGRVSMTAGQARILLCHSPGWILLTIKLMLNYALDFFWRLSRGTKRDRSLAMGNGLVGRLRRSLMDRGIPLWLNTPAKKIIIENGRAVGVEAEKEGRRIRIQARKGLILAAGGFESNQAMREQYLPNPTRTEWTCANPDNTGDIHKLGLELGAGLEFMDDGWWGPTTVVPGEARARMLVIEKSLPGSIMVNKKGERFVNEAAPYIDVVNAMYEKNTPEAPSVPAYLIFDATFRKNYPIGPFLPGSQQPDWALPRLLREQYLIKADTLEDLAKRIGVDPQGLRKTVSKFNEYARSGKDLDFNRGDTGFDRYYGDVNVKPNPCLAPIITAPFYAMEAFAGELGTKGGITVDEKARVTKTNGEVVPGLYAIGNCSSPVMGRTYAGAGATLGPAMTFGYIAAHHILRES